MEEKWAPTFFISLSLLVKPNHKKMETITRSELIKLFLNPEISGINGNTFVGIDTLTVETLKGGKGNPMQKRVTKACVGSQVQVFQNKNSNGYANMVQRRLNKEGKEVEFTLQPRTWGKRIDGTPLLVHTPKGETTEKYYLEVIFVKGGEVSYLLDSRPIKKELIEGLETERIEGSQGGLSDENKVIIRTYSIASLTRVSINKQTYIVID